MFNIAPYIYKSCILSIFLTLAFNNRIFVLTKKENFGATPFGFIICLIKWNCAVTKFCNGFQNIKNFQIHLGEKFGNA